MRPVVFIVLLATLVVTMPVLAASAEFPVSVIDDRGVDVVIDAMPERIVAVGALYAEILLGLGALDRLVAIADSPDNPAETVDLPSVGPTYAPNVELIVAQMPDLVLGATDYGGERAALEAVGITVLTTPLLTGVIDIFDSIHTVAAAIGKSAEGAALIGELAEGIIRSESLVLGRPPVRAAFLYAPTPDDPPYAAGTGAIEHELILRAGGINVFADVDGFPPVAFEAILARDPEVIFTAPSQIENLTGNPLLRAVAAIREGRVVGIRGSDATSTRIGDALRSMIEALHGIAVD